MKKILANHNDNDRVVCVTLHGKHQFFYQPARSSERVWLFDTKGYSRAIFTYFRSKGRHLSDKIYSITINELYKFKKYDNHDLNMVIRRIPGQIEYVIRAHSEDKPDAA